MPIPSLTTPTPCIQLWTDQIPLCPNSTRQYQTAPGNIRQYHAVPDSTRQHQSAPSNTRQWQAIPDSTREYQTIPRIDYYNLFKGKEAARMLKAIHNVSTRQYSLPLGHAEVTNVLYAQEPRVACWVYSLDRLIRESRPDRQAVQLPP